MYETLPAVFPEYTMYSAVQEASKTHKCNNDSWLVHDSTRLYVRARFNSCGHIFSWSVHTQHAPLLPGHVRLNYQYNCVLRLRWWVTCYTSSSSIWCVTTSRVCSVLVLSHGETRVKQAYQILSTRRNTASSAVSTH